MEPGGSVVPLGTDPRAIEKALASVRTHGAQLKNQVRRKPVSQLEFIKERIRDCDNLHKLQTALIEAIETEIWLRDDGDEPHGEMIVAIKRILED